jgi:hypothetical protein
MGLNERHHAFISATFYREIMEHCPGNGAAIFVLATQRYGEQRGSRMAQRAIRDGRPLDFATYKAYGEWSYTEEFFAAGKHLEVVSTSPDFHYRVHACPWHEQYQEMDLLEGACLYCQHIDLAISRGFNPYLEFRVLGTMHRQETCDFVLKDACLDEKAFPVDKARTQMPFDYHCGHLYWTFCIVVTSILQDRGKEISIRVLDAFRARYGRESVEVLASYMRTDFNVLPAPMPLPGGSGIQGQG